MNQDASLTATDRHHGSLGNYTEWQCTSELACPLEILLERGSGFLVCRRDELNHISGQNT